MSRSGYSDDIDQWDLICWRGAVASAIRGKRGQAFLLEMWKAMTALPAPMARESIRLREALLVVKVNLEQATPNERSAAICEYINTHLSD